MVFAPSLVSTNRACLIVRALPAEPPSDSRHWARSCSIPQRGGRLGRSRFRSHAGAVRMSSKPSKQPWVDSKDGSLESSTKTVNVIIKGKVQGVFYRNWTVDTAQQLGVNGWVRNLKDGSVEAVFSGKSAIVDSLVQKCHQGPSAARVSSVEISAWKEDVPQGFERKPTIW